MYFITAPQTKWRGGGGVCARRGRACPEGVCMLGRGACMPGECACAGGRAWSGGCAWLGPRTPPWPDTTRYGRSMSGWYASYWNAFLYFICCLRSSSHHSRISWQISAVLSLTSFFSKWRNFRLIRWIVNTHPCMMNTIQFQPHKRTENILV